MWWVNYAVPTDVDKWARQKLNEVHIQGSWVVGFGLRINMTVKLFTRELCIITSDIFLSTI